MKYIGIDPGKKGFIAVLSVYDFDKPDWNFYPIPTIQGKIVDVVELNKIFKKIKTNTEIECHAVIEKVHAIFGSSAKATFDFGYTAGLLEAMLVAHSIPYTLVTPKEWQKEMWGGVPNIKKPSKSGKRQVNDTKAMSEIAAKRLFPEIDMRRTERSSKNDDNKIDSILMAEYCRRKIKK